MFPMLLYANDTYATRPTRQERDGEGMEAPVPGALIPGNSDLFVRIFPSAGKGLGACSYVYTVLYYLYNA